MDLSGAKVDIWPGESERFATAQTENEDQHIGGIQRVMVAPGGFQESAGFLDRPPLPLWLPRIRQPHDRGGVAGKQLFGDSVGERGAEHIADVFDGPVGKYLVAAGTDGAAT